MKGKKQVISLLLALIMVLSVFTAVPLTVSAQEVDTAASGVTSGTTGDCTWTLNGTELTISGNGAMADYDWENNAPWGKSITKANIQNGVTHVSNSAFSGCISLTSVTIPDSVKSIGIRAFESVNHLTSITIPDSVMSIGNAAFYCCLRLTSITISSSVTSIGSGLFYNCEGLTSVIIPGSVTYIDDYAFKNCTGLTSVTIPDSVTSIGYDAFYNCTALTSVTIPDSITEIYPETFGYYKFDYFDELKKVNGFTICGYTGTAAETYAEDNGFTFFALANTGVTVSGSFTSYLNKPGVTVELLDQNGEQVKSVGAQDDTGSYSFRHTAAGSYTVRVSKPGHVTQDFPITVGTQAVTKNVTIYPVGDANQNGGVDMRDYAAVYKHVMKTKQLEGYALKCADANQSGGVDMRDYAAVYKHVMKSKLLW